MTSNAEIQSDVKALLKLNDSELEVELGRRLAETEEELKRNQPLTAAHGMGPTVDRTKLQKMPDFVQKTADRFLCKFDRQIYSLVCDNSDPDHAKIKAAAAQGAEAVGYALGGALIVAFGWLPGIATVVAVIIARRAAKAGHEAFCETWKERLNG
jgi:hypothetical protein